ncbi:ScpA family protein [Alicyclobacillus sp. SO9]|uniref:segregation and condensation protein A n=1 Tax=Alicyclobacillus sp. SO9 TaxID=2665646 RepID=UPI0018E8C1E0|nr:segregation/condensation protein A [Alicyclobacillus sp. SO9]QQE76906.1 segregation/condensation protein A [Alicyclobacillus sp. SO9]
MAAAYEVVLDKFSGPLDLLLHLIKKQEVDIHDIPIASVTEQYLEYLRAMEELSLEIASEFLVMASTLLAIKSRMLLPRPAQEEDDEEVADPRELLVQQLIEYQLCKHGALQLKELGLSQSQIFSRPPLDLTPYTPDAPTRVEGVSMWDLVDSLVKLLRRIPKQDRVAQIPGRVVSVEEMMESILRKLQRYGSCGFFELLSFSVTRTEVVSGFLALLELIKNGQVHCRQLTLFEEIEIVLGEEESSAYVADGPA